MKCINKTSLPRRAGDILRGNEGTSIVLVTIIAIIIVTGVVILRMTTSTLWASADKQYNQDIAYEMATSMGASVDALINSGVIKLDSSEYTNANEMIICTDSTDVGTVTVYITQSGDDFIIDIKAVAGGATYVYSAYYMKVGSGGLYTRQLL